MLHQYRLFLAEAWQLWWWQITAGVCVHFVLWGEYNRKHSDSLQWSTVKEKSSSEVHVCAIHSFYQWCQSWILFITWASWSESHFTSALYSIVIWLVLLHSWMKTPYRACWIHTKHHEFNFPAHSIMPGIPKKVLMSLIRIIVLITSAFTLMEFLWGLCLLIKQSTNQRGKSNYFLDWGQNPWI